MGSWAKKKGKRKGASVEKQGLIRIWGGSLHLKMRRKGWPRRPIPALPTDCNDYLKTVVGARINNRTLIVIV